MRCDPETGEVKGPESEKDSERVIPRIDSREIEDREADPHARVAVASRLQVEARDRHKQDGEIGLGQDAAEKGQRGIGDHIEEGPEDQRSEKHLAPESAFAVALAIADDVADRGGDEGQDRHDVVLAVQGDGQHRDREPRKHKGASLDRVLDRRGRQPQPSRHRGHRKPTLSKGTSVSIAASPMTQTLSATSTRSALGAAVMRTNSPSGGFAASSQLGGELFAGYRASHSSCDHRSRGDALGSPPDAEITTRPPSLMQSHASEAAIRAI